VGISKGIVVLIKGKPGSNIDESFSQCLKLPLDAIFTSTQ
jgi:hypothetical protein